MSNKDILTAEELYNKLSEKEKLQMRLIKDKRYRCKVTIQNNEGVVVDFFESYGLVNIKVDGNTRYESDYFKLDADTNKLVLVVKTVPINFMITKELLGTESVMGDVRNTGSL